MHGSITKERNNILHAYVCMQQKWNTYDRRRIHGKLNKEKNMITGCPRSCTHARVSPLHLHIHGRLHSTTMLSHLCLHPYTFALYSSRLPLHLLYKVKSELLYYYSRVHQHHSRQGAHIQHPQILAHNRNCMASSASVQYPPDSLWRCHPATARPNFIPAYRILLHAYIDRSPSR